MTDVRSRLLKASVLLLSSRDARDVEEAGWIYAKLLRENLDPVERAHCDAIAAALDGDVRRACQVHDSIAGAAYAA